MTFEEYDPITQGKLAEAANILSYTPNNDKMLRMHKSVSKTRVIFGGKRSGKTQWGAVECTWAGLGIHPFGLYPPPPLQIRVCGVDFTAGIKGIILPAMYHWLPPRSIKKFWAEDRILELVNGTCYEFKSYDQDLEKFEGAARDLCWMDEEPPKDVYQSNYYRTLYAGANGKLLITCTPLHGMSWIYDDLYDNPEAVPPYVEHIHVSIFENPHLNKEAVEAILKDPALRDNVEAAMYGKFIAKSGLIYKDFDYDIHTLPSLSRIPEEWVIILGIDPHDRNPHGVIFCGLDADNKLTVFDEMLEKVLPVDLIDGIKKKLHGRWPPQLAIMDTSGNAPQSISGESLKDHLEHKFKLHTIDAHKDIVAGRIKVETMLAERPPALRITRNCHNIIREIRHYVWDEWARRRERKDPKEYPLKKDDHLLDALRYVVMANVHYRHPGMTRAAGPPLDKVHPNPVTGYF